MMKVGVISDTHGLLRPEALKALAGSDLIIHAGDVGRPAVLEELAGLAPVKAVQGNIDTAESAAGLPPWETVQVEQAVLYVLHNVQTLNLDPAAAGFAAVISGHSHRASIDWRDGVLFLNPGSAGPRRFRLPVTVALLEVHGRGLHAQIVALEIE